jgi:hypothetical protein
MMLFHRTSNPYLTYISEVLFLMEMMYGMPFSSIGFLKMLPSERKNLNFLMMLHHKRSASNQHYMLVIFVWLGLDKKPGVMFATFVAGLIPFPMGVPVRDIYLF